MIGIIERRKTSENKKSLHRKNAKCIILQTPQKKQKSFIHSLIHSFIINCRELSILFLFIAALFTDFFSQHPHFKQKQRPSLSQQHINPQNVFCLAVFLFLISKTGSTSINAAILPFSPLKSFSVGFAFHCILN